MGCRSIAVGGALAAALALIAPAAAQDILTGVDLRSAPSVPLGIATPGSDAGDAIAIGDFDGDGAADVAIGAHSATALGRRAAGAVEIRYGPMKKQMPKRVVSGAAADDHSGIALANVGDVDGDGSDDLIVGAYGASPRGRIAAGSAYLVYGGSTEGLDLADPGAAAMRIDGPAARDNVGFSVSAAGDQDDDGVPDLLLGSPGADPFGRGRAGAAWIVHGEAHGGTVDLASPGARATELAGAEEVGAAGWSVTGGKDFDGDGRADVALGAPEDGTVGTNTGPGAVYVVHGPANVGGVQDLALRAPNLLEINGPFAGGLLGWSLAFTGDMTRDGRSELAIGAWNFPPNKRSQGGAVFLVNGTAETGSTIPATGGRRGFRIDGADTTARTGRAVAATGDVNGDGLPDLLIGSSGRGVEGRDFAGGADLVYGGTRMSPLDLDGFVHGIHIDGVHTNDRTGDDLAAGGDLDGDGRPDLVIGTPNGGDNRQGGAYFVADPAPVVVTVTPASRSCVKPTVTIGVNGRSTVRVTARVGRGPKRSRTVHWPLPDRHAVSLPRPPGTRAGSTLRVDVSARGSDGFASFAYTRMALRCGR